MKYLVAPFPFSPRPSDIQDRQGVTLQSGPESLPPCARWKAFVLSGRLQPGYNTSLI